MTHASSATGWFDGSSWWIRTFAAQPRAIEYASAHESHHRQLQSSTSFGGLARILDELSFEHTRSAAHDLKSVCTRVHEAFACWTPAHALGWTRAELVSVYAGYSTPFDEMQALAGGAGHAYLALHAAHAIARACMQSPVAATAATVGLSRVKLRDFRSSSHPDRRLQALLRCGIDWEPPIRRLSERLADDRGWEEALAAPKLTARILRPELSQLWESVNREMFGTAAEALRRMGFPTLGHDDHLAELAQLTAEATSLGAQYDLTPSSTRQRAGTVLRNIEAEGFSAGDLLAASWRPPGPTHSMIAGDDDPHVFLTLRSMEALALSYQGTGPIGWPAVAAVLRRSVPGENGPPVVELMDVTETFPAEPVDAGLPVVTCVAMSLLTSPLAHKYRRYLDARVSTVLVDLPLGDHLDLWLARDGAKFRYVIMRTEAQGRLVPMLIGVVDGGDAMSQLLLRPLSHASVGIHRAALEELDPTGIRIVWDPSVLDLHPELLELSLSHLVGEEVNFPPVG